MSNAILNYTAADLPHVLDKISGKNLLHNWDFRNPVNQRGITSSTIRHGGTRLMDGWYSVHGVEYGLSLDISPDGIKVSRANGATWASINQDVENGEFYLGKTLTLSALMASGELRAVTGVLSTTQVNRVFDDIRIAFEYTNDKLTVIVSAQAAVAPGRVAAVKLELGAVSTLANDPPADYVEELQKCKRFYCLWTTEAARSEALKEVGLMRLASPTTGAIVIGGVTYYYASADL